MAKQELTGHEVEVAAIAVWEKSDACRTARIKTATELVGEGVAVLVAAANGTLGPYESIFGECSVDQQVVDAKHLIENGVALFAKAIGQTCASPSREQVAA